MSENKTATLDIDRLHERGRLSQRCPSCGTVVPGAEDAS